MGSVGLLKAKAEACQLLALRQQHLNPTYPCRSQQSNSSTCIPRLSADLKASYQRGQWTAFMQRIFDHMAAQGVTKEGMEATLRAIPFTPGMEVCELVF